ncbi:hypothetical protein FIV07_12255 [Mycobacterium sp. THAF192]|nr:hypothetical protein FIV07_12255 [Mycobacterium sp. THAF192]
MTAAGAHRAPHTCEYSWCRSTNLAEFEHAADGEIALADSTEIEKIHCYAFVTDDGNVYEDEIYFGIDGKDASMNAALTVDEATRLRDLLENAIANRAEIRG